MRFQGVFFILGLLIAAFGGFMTAPTFVAWWYDDPAMLVFMETAISVMLAGGIIALTFRRQQLDLGYKEGFLVTVLAWCVLSLIGAVPLYFSGASQGSVIDAVFEAVSGITTTGATVFTGLDTMGAGALFWRSMLQWLGGMGIIVLAVAVLPFLGVGGMQLYKSELPGVTKDKLQPRLQETARMLWFVYVGLTVACTLAYMACGVGEFEAVVHAFTTVSTAGFSAHDASIGAFNSLAVEMVAVLFMLIGGVNFALHFRLFSGRSLQGYLKDIEVRVYVYILTASVGLITLFLVISGTYELPQALRYALFNVVSILTTTGYSTADYAAWPVFAPMLMLFLMFLGGCSGSTSGGMKILRVMVIVKHGAREIYKLMHPNGVVHVKIGRRLVPPEVMSAVWAFAGLYIVLFALVALGVAAFGVDMVTAFSTAAATITNVGPALGSAGPASTYAHLPDGAKVIYCLAMLLGRLEMFTLLMVLSPAFWRK